MPILQIRERKREKKKSGSEKRELDKEGGKEGYITRQQERKEKKERIESERK